METTTAVVLLCSLAIFYVGVQGQASESELRRSLLENYDVSVRPVRNYKTGIVVNMNVDFLSVDLDESGLLQTYSLLKMNWTDDYLRWSPGQWAGQKYIPLPPEQVWRPDIVLYNSAGGELSRPKLITNVLSFSDGTVLWVPPFSAASHCDIDLSRWPFDIQKCDLVFGSWVHHAYAITMATDGKTSFDDLLVNANQNWEVENVEFSVTNKYYECCEEPYTTFTCALTIRRHALFDKLLVLIPGLGVCLSTLALFWLPVGSVNKTIAFGANFVVSAFMFVSLRFLLPKVGRSVPYAAIFYAITVLLVVFFLIVSVAVTNLASRDQPVPRQWVDFPRSVLGRILCLRHRRKKDDEDESNDLQISEGRNKEQRVQSGNWTTAGTAIDRIFFYVYVLIIIIMLILFI